MTQFQERVYALLRTVPRGRVTTYGDLGIALGCPAPRAVGQAMRSNPDIPATPCHRVVSSSGAIGGYCGKTSGSAIAKKIARLRAEGVEIKNGRIVQFEKIRHRFRHGSLRAAR